MDKKLSALLKLPNVLSGNGNGKEVASNGLISKLENIRRQGKEKMLVITDFDMTLSRYRVNGDRGSTSFAVIERSMLMPEDYRQAVDDLRRKYAPMEVDPSLSEEERTIAMASWYSNAHQLLANSGLRKDQLRRIVADGNMKLREGCDTFFDLLDSHDVPLIVLSAGIQDTLVLAMEMQASVRDNVAVISNDLVYSEDDVVTGFTEPLITSSNKGNLHKQFAALSDKIQGKTNVILMGDSLGDPAMSENLKDSLDSVIKIGFLNHNVDELLPTYLHLYDIIITGDGDFSPINELCRYLLSTSENSTSPA